LVRNCIEKIIHENGFELLKLPQILTENENDEQFIKNLPDQPCFLKSNHGSGMSVYYDPNQGLPAEDQSFVKSWLDLDYAVYSGEKCYSKIDRKLFAENPIKCKDGSLPDDIKVHCYCGQPAVIQVLRRTKGYLERQTFDEKWQPRKWFQNEVLETDLSLVPMKEVIEYSTKLAEQFKYVRVDLYLVDGMLYFSELTLYPASASLPLISRNVDKELGEEFQRKCKLNSGDQS